MSWKQKQKTNKWLRLNTYVQPYTHPTNASLMHVDHPVRWIGVWGNIWSLTILDKMQHLRGKRKHGRIFVHVYICVYVCVHVRVCICRITSIPSPTHGYISIHYSDIHKGRDDSFVCGKKRSRSSSRPDWDDEDDNYDNRNNNDVGD